MRKYLLAISLLALTSCAYRPYVHDRYIPIEKQDLFSGYFSSEKLVFSSSIIGEHESTDISGAPYQFYARFVDHTRSLERVEICDFVLQEHESGNEILSLQQCKSTQFVTGSYQKGIKPYAKSANINVENLPLSHGDGKWVSLSYKVRLIGSNSVEERHYSMLFEPITEKGKFQPCCLPAV